MQTFRGNYSDDKEISFSGFFFVEREIIANAS